MKFERHFPVDPLKPYLRYFVVSENPLESEYTVFPTTGLVIGFQYKGRLSVIQDGLETKLERAGITGISDTSKRFKNSAGTGTVLVYFTEIGFTKFSSTPANELFNLSLSLTDIFDKETVREVEEKLSEVPTDRQRIKTVERFSLHN